MHNVNANGANIPALGFGTWQLEEAEARRMVATAIDLGYRHIDTAQAYENEAAVGQGIADTGIPRDDLFVTTKVWIDRFNDGMLQASTEGSLERLDLEYVDLLLLHWPVAEVPLDETLGALAQVKRLGMAKHIGLSNFTTTQIDEAVAKSPEPLAVNQVEYHPFLDQSPVRQTLDRHGLALTAYSPLAQGKVMNDDTMRAIGKAHGKTPAQVALRWLIQQPDVIAIPRSSTEAHAHANMQIDDFALDDDEMARISALATADGRLIDPDWAPRWDQAA